MSGSRHALDRRFFWMFVPPVMAVLLMVAALNLRLNFELERHRTMVMRENLLRQYSASLEKPLWDVDLKAAQAIVAALAGIPFVQGVRLSEEAGGEVVSMGAWGNAAPSAVGEIVYQDEQKRSHPVGRLEILFREPAWQDTLWQGLSVYGALFLAALVTILLTAGWALRRLVTRPLAEFQRAIESQTPGEPLALTSRGVSRDELGDVMRAYFSLLERVQSTMDRRDALRKCAGYLLEPSADFSRTVGHVLEVVRETLEVDFVQLYEWRGGAAAPGNSLVVDVGECRGGRLPDGGMAEAFPELLSRLSPGEVFGMTPRAFSPAEKEAFQACGMKSPVVVLFGPEGETSRLLVAADGGDSREWAEHDQTFLRTAVDMIESFRLRAEAEREIQTGRDRLRVLTDNLPDAYLYQFTIREGGDRAFTYVSDGIRRVLGLQPGAVEREAGLLLDLVDPAYRAGMMERQGESLLTLGDFFYETPMNLPDGRRRWAQLSARPKKMPDGSIVWQGIHRDVTAAREAEEQLQKSRDELALANAALEKAIGRAEALAREAAEANSAKSEFIANMSHEIRTPMNAIIGFSEILSSSLEDPDKRDKAEIIAESGRHLLTLVNDILDLSKIEAGRTEFLPFAFSPSALLGDIREFFQPLASEKGLTISAEWDPGLPSEIVSDELRLRQILVNLVGNAIKFTARGGVVLRCFPRDRVGEAGRKEFRFDVIDTGPGIPEEARDRIFQDFAQLSPSGHGGAGLGLSISRRLAALLGGGISVQANPAGRGSWFSVWIPSLESREISLATKPGREGVARLVFENPPEVLVVDDGKANRLLLRSFLSAEGFSVREAGEGREALALVRAHRPGLILTDIRMPGLDGREFFHLLRGQEDPGLAEIPVIAVTAAAMRERSLEDRKLFDGFLLKPVSREELLAEVARFVPHRREIADVRPSPAEDESVAQGADLLAEVEADLEARAVTVKKHLGIRDALELGGRLQEAGVRHGAPALIAYGASLEEAARGFQIDRVKSVLELFFSFLLKLRGKPAANPEKL